jgi:hypothetical protein
MAKQNFSTFPKVRLLRWLLLNLIWFQIRDRGSVSHGSGHNKSLTRRPQRKDHRDWSIMVAKKAQFEEKGPKYYDLPRILWSAWTSDHGKRTPICDNLIQGVTLPLNRNAKVLFSKNILLFLRSLLGRRGSSSVSTNSNNTLLSKIIKSNTNGPRQPKLFWQYQIRALLSHCRILQQVGPSWDPCQSLDHDFFISSPRI